MRLNTERLLLRELREQDLDDYARLVADPETMRYLGGTLTRTEAWRQMATILGHWQLRGYGLWAVEHQPSGDFIGRIGFINPEGWPGFELGWLIAREHWGNGYATEGARAALTYAFEQLGREHVISLIHPENHRSIGVAARLGEKLEGSTVLEGQEALVYGIHRDASGSAHEDAM